MRSSLYLTVLIGILASAGSLRADPITFSGSDAGLTYDGSATYSPGTLSMTLHNSSGSTLTGFAFSSSSTNVTVGLSSQSNSGFTLASLGAAVYPNFGSYQFAVSGGTGLLAGQTTHLTFTVQGGTPEITSAITFFTEGGTNAASGFENEPFVAQFGSQYVPDVVGVPLPSTTWAGMGLLGLFGVGQRLYSRRAIA